MVDTLFRLQAEARHWHSRPDGDVEAQRLGDLLTDAADELEELRERIKHCAVGACPVLADLALKDFD